MTGVRTLILLCLVTVQLTHCVPNKSRYSRAFVHHVTKLLENEFGHHGFVFPRGSYHYEMRRRVHNGLCAYRFPDIIVAPKTTEQVAKVVRVARKVGMEISVRSGGHSFLCNNIKSEGIHIDLRYFKKTSYFRKFLKY